MRKVNNFAEVESMMQCYSIKEMTDAMTGVLLDACLFHLDTERHGFPTEEDAFNIQVVRHLLEAISRMDEQ